MSDVKIKRGEWVVVCDGKKGLVLENLGDAEFLNLRTIYVFDHPDRKTHELGTDAPGRTVSSVGEARSTMEPTDWHEQEEERFLRMLASYLDAQVKAGRTKALIVVAPPRALGVLRQAYSSGMRDAVQAEIDKDFVMLPVHEIEQRLSA